MMINDFRLKDFTVYVRKLQRIKKLDYLQGQALFKNQVKYHFVSRALENRAQQYSSLRHCYLTFTTKINSSKNSRVKRHTVCLHPVFITEVT